MDIMRWKLVPQEPTNEMIDAAIDTTSMMIADRYKAMLAAAPIINITNCLIIGMEEKLKT